MKVEGTEKELKKLFKPKSNNQWFPFRPFKSKKKLSKDKKKLIIYLSLIVGVVIIAILGQFIYLGVSNNHLTKTECSIKVNSEVAEALYLQEQNSFLGIAYVYYGQIKLMLIAIAIAWIVHGVGFHIIKR